MEDKMDIKKSLYHVIGIAAGLVLLTRVGVLDVEAFSPAIAEILAWLLIIGGIILSLKSSPWKIGQML